MNDVKMPLICIGGGGHCKSVINVAESLGYNIKGVLDLPEKIGQKILSYTVIGCDDDMDRYINDCQFIITVGHIKSPEIRLKIWNRLSAINAKVATIVASSACVSNYAKIGRGTVVLNHAVVNAGAEIGINCIINIFANIEHDVHIGDFCHISTGAMINGDCCIGNNTFIGSQSVVVNGITVPEKSVVAAASLMRKTYSIPGVYSGNPAKLLIPNTK